MDGGATYVLEDEACICTVGPDLMNASAGTTRETVTTVKAQRTPNYTHLCGSAVGYDFFEELPILLYTALSAYT